MKKTSLEIMVRKPSSLSWEDSLEVFPLTVEYAEDVDDLEEVYRQAAARVRRHVEAAKISFEKA